MRRYKVVWARWDGMKRGEWVGQGEMRRDLTGWSCVHCAHLEASGADIRDIVTVVKCPDTLW